MTPNFYANLMYTAFPYDEPRDTTNWRHKIVLGARGDRF